MATLKITLVKSPIGAIPKQRATIEALSSLKSPEEVAASRGKSVADIVG